MIHLAQAQADQCQVAKIRSLAGDSMVAATAPQLPTLLFAWRRDPVDHISSIYAQVPCDALPAAKKRPSLAMKARHQRLEVPRPAAAALPQSFSDHSSDDATTVTVQGVAQQASELRLAKHAEHDGSCGDSTDGSDDSHEVPDTSFSSSTPPPSSSDDATDDERQPSEDVASARPLDDDRASAPADDDTSQPTRRLQAAMSRQRRIEEFIVSMDRENAEMRQSQEELEEQNEELRQSRDGLDVQNAELFEKLRQFEAKAAEDSQQLLEADQARRWHQEENSQMLCDLEFLRLKVSLQVSQLEKLRCQEEKELVANPYSYIYYD
mmetsp:Transcript_70166/g.198049  ORF Transcript_70166/g.198049 Transcript_70166/m.198049 type:complete len:323 (+) Transcript_70166:3-971(+)